MIKGICISVFVLVTGLSIQAQDSMCIKLMEPEAQIGGAYVRINEFHFGLMFECRQPEQAPYPSLVRLFSELTDSQSQIITLRGEGCLKIDSVKQSRKSTDPDVELIYRSYREKLDQGAQEFDDLRVEYDSLCTQHEIQMITHFEYGDSLMVRLMAWQDSLVAQGSLISRCNRGLKASGLESVSDEYRSRYQHISQMQLIHKEFQAKLMQVENQQSRYASARPEEVFYLGPYLVERHDVSASEGFFVDLIEMQDRFQGHRGDFQEQNSD
jgi:hypothetical protein